MKRELNSKQKDYEEELSRVKHLEKLLDDKKLETKELRGLVQTLETSIHAKGQEIRHLKATIEEISHRAAHQHHARGIEDIDASRISPSKYYFRGFAYKFL